MSVEVTRLPGVKPGAIPYYSASQWTVPVNDPSDLYVPYWQSGHLRWASVSTPLGGVLTTPGDMLYVNVSGVITRLPIGNLTDIMNVQNGGGGIGVPGWTPAVSTVITDFNEAAQDAVGAMVANSTKVSLTYVDATPSLTADINAGSLGPVDIANRTRVWPIDVGAGFQTAGTGTKTTSNGLGIQYLDTETGTWRWSLPIPADLVTGQVTLYLQWATALTTGNVLWLISVGSTGAGVAHSATNISNALTSLVTVNGTTLLQTQTTFPSTNNVTAGLGDIAVAVSRIGGDVSDTAAGTIVLYALWISYTADS